MNYLHEGAPISLVHRDLKSANGNYYSDLPESGKCHGLSKTTLRCSGFLLDKDGVECCFSKKQWVLLTPNSPKFTWILSTGYD